MAENRHTGEAASWKLEGSILKQLHAMQSVSRLAVWYVLLHGSYRWSTVSWKLEAGIQRNYMPCSQQVGWLCGMCCYRAYLDGEQSAAAECDRGEFDLGNRVAGLVNSVAGKALGQTNKVVRSEVGSWKHVSRAITCHAVSK